MEEYNDNPAPQQDASLPSTQRPDDYYFPPIVFGLVALVVIFLVYQLAGAAVHLSLGLNEQSDAGTLRLVTMGAHLVFILLPTLLCLKLQPWPAREWLRLKRPAITPIALAVIGVIALQFPLQGYLHAQDYLLRTYVFDAETAASYDAFRNSMEEVYTRFIRADSPGELAFVLLVVVVTPAITEEFLFRGMAQGAFERRMAFQPAAILNSAVFALFHLNPVNFLALFLLGWSISWFMRAGKSIWVAVAAHAANNTIAVISLYFISSEPTATERDLSPEGVATASIIGAFVFLFCVWFLSVRTRLASEIQS